MSPVIQMKILGLDIGSKRIGLAYWEPSTRWIVTLPRLDRKVLKKDLEYLRTIVNKYDIEAFVVGIPYSLAGKITPSTESALFWVGKLEEEFKLPVFKQDESFSTTEALERLSHKKPKDRAAKKDSVSASIILEEFMKEQNEKI